MLSAAAAEWLTDRDYLPFVRAAVQSARERVLVLQFVMDPRPEVDDDGAVRYLLHALAEAAHRGADVRVLLSELIVARPFPIDLNEPPARFLRNRGVAVRRQPARLKTQMHAKAMVVDDDIVIAGGHNWTPGAFALNTEASLAVRSEECATQVAGRFDTLWAQAESW